MKLNRAKLFLSLFILVFTTIAARAQVANFTADVTSGCATLLVHFHNTSSGATSYHWDLGNGTTSGQQDVSGTFVTNGTFTVVLTAYGANGSSSTHSMTITVYPTPTIAFSANPTVGCPGFTVNFTDQSN